MKGLFLLFLGFSISLNVLNANQYIRSSRLYLYDSPEFNANRQVFSIKGAQIQTLEKKGIWVRINVKGKNGWVNRLNIVDNYLKFNPSNEINPPKVLKLKKKRKSVRLRVARTAIGIKGLRESQTAVKDRGGNIEALRKMISFQIAKDQGIKFVMDYKE